MSDPYSVSTSVEVAVDPATAFQVFTEELDCWWIQGPINFYDSSRAYNKRMEPGVGGRIIEVYDEGTGEGLELARLTVWEPGRRVGWQSSLDDVAIDVRFEGTKTGTVVRVEATIPAGGKDVGGTSWLRMTPVWLGAWIEKRDRLPHEPMRMARLAVGVHYAEPAKAARWLHEVFDLEPAGNLPDDESDPEHTWIEFHVGNCSLMVFGRDGERDGGAPTHTPWVFVDDLDQHYAQTKERGATITEEIWEHGARAYGATDLEGNHWTFAQASPRQH
jgi:uncharacterized glyoxalase superfamily protein PhnB